jgi:hypothetical protein
MGFEIDLLNLPFLALPSAGALILSLALRDRLHRPWVAAWVVALWSEVLANLLFVLRPPAWEPILVPLRNAAWMACASLVWWGSARLSRRASMLPVGLGIGTIAALQAYFTWIHPFIPARAFVLSAALALFYGAAARALSRLPRPSRSGVLRFAVVVVGLHGVYYGGRALFFLSTWHEDGPQRFTNSEIIVTMTFLTVSLILLQAALWALARMTSLEGPP